MSARKSPLTPAQQIERVRRLCDQHGASLVRQRSAWRIVGPFIDTLAADLTTINAEDFMAPKLRQGER